MASLLKALKCVMFMKFAPSGERSNRKDILADRAIALAWPGAGQLCAGVVERLEAIG